MKNLKWQLPESKSVPQIKAIKAPEVEATLRSYIDLGRQIKELEVLRAQAKQVLVSKMGDEKRIEIADMFASQYETTRRTIDVDGAIEKFGVKALGKLLKKTTSVTLRTGFIKNGEE